VSPSERMPTRSYRVQRLLNEQAFLGITESEYTGGGPGEGSYRIHRLLRDADVVVEAIDGA
jgi:cell division control protein 6